MFKCTILMNPVAKGRPRLTTFGGHARAYTPGKTLKYEHDMKQVILSEMQKQGVETFDCPLSVNMTFYIAKPKSKSKKILYPTTRPDLDNYIKAVLDACNKVLMNDDSQVVNLRAKKRYGLPERTELKVIPALEDPQEYQEIVL